MDVINKYYKIAIKRRVDDNLKPEEYGRLEEYKRAVLLTYNDVVRPKPAAKSFDEIVERLPAPMPRKGASGPSE